jgi:hypothetical protein
MQGSTRKTPHLDELGRRLADDLSVESWGYEQLGDLTDERQRAIVSDQILATVDAVGTNLREASEHASAFIALVGPNGRAIPDPERPQELREMHQLDREVVGFFRAAGSLLDCLAGAVIGVLRLPLSIQRADASALGRLTELAAAAQGDGAMVWSRAGQAVEAVRVATPQGWFEWTLEMRNAVVHRARQIRVWLPRSPRTPGQPRLIVRTEHPLHRLVRFDPHLRRRPWLPDLAALAAEGEATENWLPESASVTVSGILDRLERMIEAVAEILLDVWDDAAARRVHLAAPAANWPASHGSPAWRVAAAETFVGFEPNTQAPPLTSIVMNPRDARRAQIAERLRTRK